MSSNTTAELDSAIATNDSETVCLAERMDRVRWFLQEELVNNNAKYSESEYAAILCIGWEIADLIKQLASKGSKESTAVTNSEERRHEQTV